MLDFKEWGQSVRMFSNKVKEVQSKFQNLIVEMPGWRVA